MAQIIITESKKEKMTDLIEEMLMAGGKLMHCLEELDDDSEMNERRYRNGMGMRDGGRYGSRGGYGNRDWDDMDYSGERRRRY